MVLVGKKNQYFTKYYSFSFIGILISNQKKVNILSKEVNAKKIGSAKNV